MHYTPQPYDLTHKKPNKIKCIAHGPRQALNWVRQKATDGSVAAYWLSHLAPSSHCQVQLPWPSMWCCLLCCGWVCCLVVVSHSCLRKWMLLWVQQLGHCSMCQSHPRMSLLEPSLAFGTRLSWQCMPVRLVGWRQCLIESKRFVCQLFFRLYKTWCTREKQLSIFQMYLFYSLE